MQYRCKAIVSDLDGTLLRGGAQKLEDETLKLIKELRNKGILFIAASGRQYINMQRLFGALADDIYFICENGSLIAERGEILYKAPIDRELFHEILDQMLWTQQDYESEIVASAVDASLVVPSTKGFDDLLRTHVNNSVRTLKSYSGIQDEIIKISIYFPEGIPLAQRQEYKRKFSGRLQVVDSGNGWLDVTACNVNKGSALKKLSEKIGVGLEEMVSFGDSENDISMLELTGESYAMDTAAGYVKKAGTGGCSAPEDYFRKLLESS